MGKKASNTHTMIGTIVRWGLLILGLLLLLPLSFFRRNLDMDGLFAPLHTVSLRNLQPDVESSFSFRIPDGKNWEQAGKDWGTPDYAIVIRRSRDSLECVSAADLQLRLESAPGHSIAVSPTTEVPYGFTVDCSNPARKFAALAGSTIAAHVLYRGDMDLGASDLVILPLWPGNAKDHIVGEMISREINPVIVSCALAGVIALIASTCMFLRKRSVVRP